jgi:hypothetical protein
MSGLAEEVKRGYWQVLFFPSRICARRLIRYRRKSIEEHSQGGIVKEGVSQELRNVRYHSNQTCRDVSDPTRDDRAPFRLVRTRFESTKLAWREVLQPVFCSNPSTREGMLTFQRVEHVLVPQVPAVVPSFVHGPVVLLGVLHHERVLRTSQERFGVKRNWLTLGRYVPLNLPCLLGSVLA